MRTGKQQQRNRTGLTLGKEGTTSSAASFWKLLKASDPLSVALGLCVMLCSAAVAETETVRLGEHFRYSAKYPYSGLGTIAALQDQLGTDMQHFVTGFQGCADIVVRDLYEGIPRDSLSDTWTVIQSFRVECWVALNFDPDVLVAPTLPEDRITPDMIYKIMAKARQLSDANEE